MRTCRANGALPALVLLAAVAGLAGCSEQPPPASKRTVVAELNVSRAAAGNALVTIAPDAKDGFSGRNPPGTVEVASTALLAEDFGPNVCGTTVVAVHAPVRIRNYAPETLGNVTVQFTDLNPTDHVVCNTVSNPPPGVAPMSGLITGYNNLAGTVVGDGSQPGGEASVEWWITYPGATPFSFRARIWADVTPEPPTGLSPAADQAFCNPATCEAVSTLPDLPAVLSWTGTTQLGRIEISTDPAFATTIEAAYVTGTGGPAYSFSYTVSDQTPGRRYWRVANRFVPTGGTDPVIGTFWTSSSYIVDAPPTELVAEAVVGDPSCPEPTLCYRILATSIAPGVEFFSWNWAGSPAGPYYTVGAPYFYFPARGNTGTRFAAGAIEPDYDVGGNPANPNIGVSACTQYGVLGTFTTLGSCVAATYQTR